MEDFNSKYTGQQVEDILDQVASGNAGGGGGGATSAQLYITTFDVLSLYNLAQNPNEVGGIKSDNQAITDALVANKIVLVPYAIGDESIRGYATLVGYAEDFLYFKVITDNYEICVETSHDAEVILGQEVTYRDWDSKQDALKSGENIKTINGESIVGSGNITIGGGGSSSGNGAYSEVNHGTSDTTFTLTPNTFHIWEEVSALTLTLGGETSGFANEYLFQFTSGATATTLTLPDDIKWANELTIEPNMIYQVSILKGLASVLEWDNAPTLIENKATLSIGTSNYIVTFEYPVASELFIKVSTPDGNSTNTMSPGESSITLKPMGPIPNTSAYIVEIVPGSDSTYVYTF